MKSSRTEVFEAQLKAAVSAVERRLKVLVERKVVGKKEHRKDPIWRQLNAKVTQYKTRIAAMKFEADREVDLATRRVEREAKAKEPKVKKKKAVEVKAKAPKKAKGEGKGPKA